MFTAEQMKEQAKMADDMAEVLHTDIAHLSFQDQVLIANALLFRTLREAPITKAQKVSTCELLVMTNALLFMVDPKAK